MNRRLKLAAIAVLVVGVGVSALVMSGVWPGRSRADLEQARVHTAQASAHLQSGDQDAALRSLDESIRLYPLADAQSMRASIRIARNDFEGALRDVSAVIGRGAHTAENYSLRCWLRVRLDSLDRASADCDRALRLDPAHASAFGNRGLIGLKRRHYQAAWEDFNIALRVGGSDEWVAWRVFGRGLAAWGQGRVTQGRQDVEMALRSNPGVAAQFAQFGLGGEVMRELEDAAYAAATSPRSLLALQQYLYLYPNGAHAAEARAQVGEIYAWIAEDEAAGRRALPGFSFAHARGPGSASDSYGALALFVAHRLRHGLRHRRGSRTGRSQCVPKGLRRLCVPQCLRGVGDQPDGSGAGHGLGPRAGRCSAHCAVKLPGAGRARLRARAFAMHADAAE